MSMINVTAAIDKTGRCRATICRWLIVYKIGDSGIGHMSGGRYMVDPDKLDMIVNGQQKQLFEMLIKESIKEISTKGIPVITVKGKTILLNVIGGEEANTPLTPLKYERKHIQYEDVMFLIQQEGFQPKGSQGDCLVYMRDKDCNTKDIKQSKVKWGQGN